MTGRSWRVWLVFLGVFVAGAIAGGVVAMRFKPTKPTSQPDDLALRIMHRFSEQLALTPEQKAAVEPHVQRAAQELHQMRAQTAEAMQALEQAVARELTPEQRSKLEVMQTEQRARWKKWLEKKREFEREGGKPGPRAEHDRPRGTGP